MEQNEDMLLMAYTHEEEEISDDDIDQVLMAHSRDREPMKKRVWFLDSGCSNHMSRDQDLFSSMDLKFKHSVKLENNMKMEVTGKGNVRLVLNNNAYIISDIYYV